MKRVSAKKISILLAIAIVGTLVILYVLFIAIRNRARSAFHYETELEQIIAADVENRSLRSLFEKSGSEIDKLSTRFIEKEGTVAYIEMLENLARSSNLRVFVESVQVQGLNPPDDKHENLALSVAVQGTWKDVTKYGALLETLPYKVVISNVNLSEDTIVGGGSVWKGVFTFLTLKQK